MAQEKSVTAILQAKDSGFSSTFGKANSLLGAFAGENAKASGQSKGFLGSIKSVAAGMGLYKIAAAATARVTNSVTGAMSRADTLYLFNRNMKEITGSSAIASQKLKELSGTTSDTAYSLDSVANSTQSFANANIDVGKSMAYSTRFMDLVSRYGDGTNETFKQVTLQMTQMASKGKANLGDIKSAVEANIPVWSILSKETGKSVQEIQDEISAGQWTSEEFFDTLMAGSENAAGAAKDGANTWAGALGIMNSRFTLGMTNILGSVQKVGEALTGDKFGVFKGITSIGTFAKESMTKVGHAIEGSIPFFMIFKNSVERIIEPTKQAFKSVADNVGFLNLEFSKTDALTLFSSVMNKAADKAIQFARFIDRNSESIGKFIDKMPQAVAAIGTLKVINSATTAFANFGLTISGTVMSALGRLSTANSIVNSSLVVPIQNGMKTIGSAISSTGGSFILFNSNLVTSFRQIREFDSAGNIFKDSIRAMDSALDLSGGKLAQFGSKILHPVQSINTLKSNLMLLSTSAGGTGTVMSGLGMKVGGAFKSMASVGISSIRALSAAMLSNPITAILLAITATVAFVAMSWRSNFMNIQGVISTFSSGVGNSLKGLGNMFKGLEPVVKPVINVLKALGAVLTGVVLFGISAVVDAFRLMVFAVTSVIKSIQALGHGLSGLWKKIKGDSEGADESFKKMDQSIKSIGDGFDELKNNSAMKAATESVQQFGKETEKSADMSKRSIKDVIGSVDELNAKTSQINSDLSLSFNIEGQTDGIKNYINSATQILEEFNQKRLDTANKYNDLMTQAESAKGKERVALEKQANDLILSQYSQNNNGMMALQKEFSDQLKSNKNIEGQELTAEQRAAMEAQLQVIREGLMQQNELYVQAAMQRLQNGEQLSQQEQQAAEANLKALYANQTEQISANEQKIAELKKQYDEAKTESQKANLEAQTEALKLNNEQLLQQQQLYGEQELQLLLNGNEQNAQAVLQGLSQRGNITNEQLGLILQAFNQSNSDVGESLTLLAGIMEQKGIEGSAKLVEALRSGDLTSLGGELSQEMINGINSLPPEMFNKGNEGKAQLITSLQNGDLSGAASSLVGSAQTGLAPLPNAMGTIGGDAGKNAASSLDGTKGQMQNAGSSVMQSGEQGAKSKLPMFNPIGVLAGTNQATGLSNTKGANNTAGVGIATAAYTGANSRTGEFNSIGYNMGAGVASGLNSSLGDVRAAADAVVAEAERAAKAKAKIKSPARLFMPIGNFMGQGVGVGMIQSLGFIKDKTNRLVDSIANQVQQNRALDFAFSGGSSVVRVESVSKSTVNNDMRQMFEKVITAIESGQKIYLDNGQLIGATDKGLAERTQFNKRRSMKS